MLFRRAENPREGCNQPTIGRRHHSSFGVKTTVESRFVPFVRLCACVPISSFILFSSLRAASIAFERIQDTLLPAYNKRKRILYARTDLVSSESSLDRIQVDVDKTRTSAQLEMVP